MDDVPGQRLDARMLRSALIHAATALDHWPRFRQPSWYTGEVAFGVVALLLPTAPAGQKDALRRCRAAFLAAGAASLAGQPTPTEWCERAERECMPLCAC